MSTVININTSSIMVQRHLQLAVREQQLSMERLASGKRINSARDDAAGLQLDNKLTSQERGLSQAIRNANDGVSMLQIAEGALEQTTSLLHRMRELSIQSANGTFNDRENRMSLDAEFKQLKAEIDRVSESAIFNQQQLFGGKQNISLQVGANANETIDFLFQKLDTESLGVGSRDADLVGSTLSVNATSDAEIKYNDVLINGQTIVGPERSFSAGDSPDVLTQSINDNVNGVSARYITTNSIETAGDGVLTGGDVLSVTLTLPDLSTQIYEVKETHSPEELIDKLNAVGRGAYEASLDDLGRISVTADNVYAIKVKAPIGAINRPENEISNASFETGSADGWSFNTSFAGLSGDTPGSISQSASVTNEDANDGDYSLKLNISGAVTVGYGTAHGPEVISSSFRAASGDTLSFDLKALDSGDDYDYYVYLENGETGERVQVQYDRGDNSPWSEVSVVVPWDSEQTRFVFINGTYDATGGKAVGSTLYIDNVQLSTNTFFTTSYGKLALTSESNDPITVERGTTGSYSDLEVLGFREQSGLDTIKGSGITAASTPWEAGDLMINGVDIIEPISSSSLISKIGAVNSFSEQTGVRAEAFVSAELSIDQVSDGSVVAFTINGISINPVVLDGNQDNEQVAAAINQISNQTGIQAVFNGGIIQLEGNAVSLTIGGSEAATGLGDATLTYIEGATVKTSTALASYASADTVAGGIQLISGNNKPISLQLGDQSVVEEHGFLGVNSVGDHQYGNAISSVDVKTADRAQQAIGTIDQAIEMVDKHRGELGAVQNRLEQAADAMMNTVQYTEAAQSRIMDADFAKESAALSRAQVLQQAGSSMLAQANASPKQVLQLLQQ